MVNHYVPSQWKEYCGKSKAWCDGFREAVEKANKKESDPKLEAVLKDIGGAIFGSSGAPTQEHKHINPNSAGIKSPLWTYIAAYFIIITFSVFVVGLCCSNYCSKKTNSKSQSISKSKNSKNSKNIKNNQKNKSKDKKILSIKNKKSSTKTSKRKSKAKSSKKSTAKSSKNTSKKQQNQSVSTKRTS